MWADSAVGLRSSAPSAARALTVACWMDPVRHHWSKPCRSPGRSGRRRGPRPVELAGFDAQPALHEARVGVAVRPLREAELIGPACRRAPARPRRRSDRLARGRPRPGRSAPTRSGRQAGTTPPRSGGLMPRRSPPWPPRGGNRRHRTRREATPPPRRRPRSPDGTTAAPCRGPRAATRDSELLTGQAETSAGQTRLNCRCACCTRDCGAANSSTTRWPKRVSRSHTLTSSPGAQSDHLMVTPDQAAPFTKTFAAPAMWSLTVAAARSASPDSIASTMS
jgi:hypothetical protein